MRTQVDLDRISSCLEAYHRGFIDGKTENISMVLSDGIIDIETYAKFYALPDIHLGKVVNDANNS
jgi:hypothetical protein